MRARAAALLFVAGGTGAWAQERRPLPVPDLPGLGLFQGMELVNGEDFYPAAYPWIEEKQLAILATSDYHLPTPPRGSGPPRPITLVFARTAGDLAAPRFRRPRCAAGSA
jgi:hypothetical protein